MAQAHGSGRTAYHPGPEQECRILDMSEGDRQGVNRPDDAPAGRRKGASLVPGLARPVRS